MIFNEISFDFHETALHIAVKKGNIEIVKLLLGMKDINITLIDEIKT